MLAQASWVVVVGDAGDAVLESLCDAHAPILIVESDLAHLETLSHVVTVLGLKDVELIQQLVGGNTVERPWFRYSDPRKDGLLSLPELQSDFPNLQLEGVEMRQQIGLAQLLQEWEPAQVDGGVLVLPAHAEPDWLDLARSALSRLLVLAWRIGDVIIPNDLALALDDVLREAWLVPQDSGCHLPVDFTLWLRDEQLQFQASVLLERDSLRCQVQQMELEHRALLAERDDLSQEREDLQRQVRVLETRMAAINLELDGILALLDGESIAPDNPVSGK